METKEVKLNFKLVERCMVLEGNKNGQFVVTEFKKKSNVIYFQLKYLKSVKYINPLFRSNIGSIDLTDTRWCYVNCFLDNSEVNLFLDYYVERLDLLNV